MSKKICILQSPIDTLSGYGNHSRDIAKALFKILPDDEWEIIIVPTIWGNTPHDALDPNNLDDFKILDHFIKNRKLNSIPDLFIQITIPSEFIRVGKFNIGITAGTETTLASMEFIDGCNRMDLVITPSEFTKNVLGTTKWTKKNQQSGQIESEIFVTKPIEVLFEGLDERIFNKTAQLSNSVKLMLDPIPEDFLFLVVGHWLKGDMGHDRKDIGNTIKVFYETFKNSTKKPGLVLKLGTTCEIDKNIVLKKVKEIAKLITKDLSELPNIYLINGNLMDEEMNSLYNHKKIKAMISFSHGEGFGRPLLEFSATGKIIMAPDWSGQKDFLSMGNAILLKGKLEKIHPSAAWDHILLKDSSWFRVDYEYASIKLEHIFNNYGQCEEMGRRQANNIKNFTLDKMAEKFEIILKKYYIDKEQFQNEENLFIPKLPQLTKLNKTIEDVINEDDEKINDNFDVNKLEGFKDINI